jgi:diguanylate cyclase (GGDEF)-like protein/PAS domain S-box-containing protein
MGSVGQDANGSTGGSGGQSRPLVATEAHVRALLHGSQDLQMLVDQAGRLQWVSERVTAVLGYAAADAVGRHALDLVHPDDAAALIAGIRTVLRDHRRWSASPPEASAAMEPLAARMRDHAGGWVRVEGVCSAKFTAGGGLVGVLINVRDVAWPPSAEAAVRCSEERYRALVRHSADAVVVTDGEGRVSYASPGLERLFGWPPALVEGREWLPFVVVEDRDAVRQVLVDVARCRPGEPRLGQFRVRHRSGGWRWAEAVSVNHLGDPSVAGVVTNVRDVTARLAAEEALRASEARFRTVVSGSFDVTAVLDGEGVVRWVTPNCRDLLGCAPGEIVGRSGLDWVHPDNLGEMAEALCVFASGAGVSAPAAIRMRHADGGWRHVEIVATDFLDHPDIGGIAVSLRDIGERVAAERERERLTEIFAMTTDLVSTHDIEGRLVYMNEAARRFLGFDPDDPIDLIEPHTRLTPSARETVSTEVIGAIAAGRTWTGELDVYDATGAVVPMQAQLLGHRDRNGTLLHVSGVLRDISERKDFEHRLRYEATHDPLTSLPNRSLLLDRLGSALSRGRQLGTGVALLFCDLDHFKVVNDSLGHGYGDLLLCEVARRLSDQVRPGDTVARFGGDEFVILGESCAGESEAVGIATRIEHAMRQAFDLDGNEVYLGVSIGIALASPGPGPAPDPGALIRDADAAMYRAKERGRGRYQIFEPFILEQAVDRLDIESALHRALAHDELDLLYQPVVDLRSAPGEERIVGVEALVRWDHGQRPRLRTAELLTLADDSGVAEELGAWALRTACVQMASWLEELPIDARFSLAVSLSRRQLANPDLVDTVADVLRTTGVDPGRLDLEVTERVLTSDLSATADVLSALKKLGVNIAVDDFGAGCSSLTHLRRFPVDRLKVDGDFVTELSVAGRDRAIVAAIVDLAHALGMVAIGEGVESADQLTVLRELGCDLAQGEHFGGPLSGVQLAARLRSGCSS